MARQTVEIRIRGQEFRVVTDDDGQNLQRIAGYLDETMSMVERRTGTVDSLDLALLSALNLAREVVELREGRAPSAGLDPEVLRDLTVQIEAELEAGAP